MLSRSKDRPPLPQIAATFILLASYLGTSYERDGNIHDLDGAIVFSREALSLSPPGHPVRLAAFVSLASYLTLRYNQLGRVDDLEEAIVLGRESLSLRPPGNPDRFVSLGNLAHNLSSRYKQLGRMDDLEEAVILQREALSLCPIGHPDRSKSLNNIASQLFFRYHRFGEIDDLEEAIVLCREALSLCPRGHPDRLASLGNLANNLISRYEQLGKTNDLQAAIGLCRKALSLCPIGHRDRSRSLINLAGQLSSRYRRLGGIDDLEEAIVLGRESLSLCPPGHPSRSASLGNLAQNHSFRYRQLGQMGDLEEAIVLQREALSLGPPGHVDRPKSLDNLAGPLCSRYQRLGEIDDLEEAIVLCRESLSLRPPGHPHRFSSLGNLAENLSSRFEWLGEMDDFEEAVALHREALSLCPPGHFARSKTLENLGGQLSSRYQWLRGIDDLNEALVLHREALSLCPRGHPARFASLGNLASDLFSQHEQLGKTDALEEAIFFCREALSLCPLGHPDRSASLNNLAILLFSRYRQLGTGDPEEAIALWREALSLCPPEHPLRSTSLYNLAALLFSRFKQLQGIDYLNEAIVLGREAVSLRPPGHPDRSASLSSLANHLSSRYKHLKVVDDLNGAMEDRKSLFALYVEVEHVAQTVTVQDLSAARAWADTAEEFHHPTTLSAYETALRLLAEHSAALPPLPQHLVLLKSLSSSLAADAFSACLRNQSFTKAVELLEQGRGVFWSQLARLRSPLDDVITSGPRGKALATEFTRLTSLIRTTLRSPSPDQHDRVWSLNLQLKKVVSDIRELPGLSRFLLPSLFSDLQRAARDGPVIIVNASKYGCDALVVFVDRDPVHIPLEVTRKDVRKLSLKLRELNKHAKGTKKDFLKRDFMIFLRELWDSLVSHIIDSLKTTCPPQSRIWWCPTVEFSLLPLHAAAPYRTGQKGVSDLYISSYTTTLTALVRARQTRSLDSASEKKTIIAIGQAAANTPNELFSVGAELANIGQLVDGLATYTHIEGEDSCIATVANELGKNEWAHFACHGVPNQKHPFESGFALQDGRFTIQHIIQCDLQNPEFAYLSACHTTVGDRESPDEVIHIASAMQFAGFRSVIGTMWAVDDSETDEVTSVFYKLMIDGSGRLDYTRAARALRKTVRTVNIPIDQRILYIHLGA